MNPNPGIRYPRGGSSLWTEPTPGAALLDAEFFGADAPTNITGTLSATLADATLVATGTLPAAALTGELTATLGAATLASTSTLRIAGTLTGTLGAATAQGAGVLPIAGVLAATLGDATLSADASLAGEAPEPEAPAKTGGGGPAFRPKSKRHASPYRDLRETADELLSRDTLELSEVADISAPSEAAKPASRKAERADKTPDILADISAQAAAASVMGDAIRAVEGQLRAAIEAKEMDEEEAIALILILAEA